MIVEQFPIQYHFSKAIEGNKLLGQIVFSTEINRNGNYTFTEQNLIEFVTVANKQEVFAYVGHPKKAYINPELMNDRLPYRVGYFENFRVDGNYVRADLVLSDSNDVNPVLEKFEWSNWVKTLATTEDKKCGYSVEVGIMEVNQTPVIKELYAIALVEKPALTSSMFSVIEEPKPQEEDIIMEAPEELKQFSDALATDDQTLIADAAEKLMIKLGEYVKKEEEKEAEAPTEQVMNSVNDSLMTKISELIDAKFSVFESKFTAIDSKLESFSIEPKKEEKEEKIVTINYSTAPELETVEIDHFAVHRELKLKDPMEAQRYYNKHIFNRG